MFIRDQGWLIIPFSLFFLGGLAPLDSYDFLDYEAKDAMREALTSLGERSLKQPIHHPGRAL